MSNFLREICSALIEDTYGEFYAHIFSTLQSRGRLIAPSLAQKCRLPLRHVHRGLAVLVQLGLVFHFTTGEGRTSYEANLENAYNLARSCKVVDLTEKRYGPVAASIVTQLLLLGHASVRYLKETSWGCDRSAMPPITDNKATAGPSTSDSLPPPRNSLEFEDALRLLCEHGLVSRLRESHFRTEADNRQIAENKVKSQSLLSTAKGTKLRDEIAAKVQMEMDKQVYACIKLPKPSPDDTMAQKRKASEFDTNSPSSKRRKLANGVAAKAELPDQDFPTSHGSSSFDGKLVVTLNLGRFAIMFRNSHLIDLVTKTYGADMSRPYGAILEQMTSQLPNIAVDARGSEKERPAEISAEVDERRLAGDLACPQPLSADQENRIVNTDGHANGSMEQLSTEARSHLETLCQGPYKFLLHSSDRPNKYTIDYAGLAVHLRNTEVFRIISVRFDRYAARIVRVLLSRGKLDEKHLQEIILMSAKELRQTLANLHEAGFVELQEVPREAQRQPSRTMYLWFYDADRVRQMLIEDTYKCMARCMQRMKLERRKAKPTIEKSERSDMKEQEENLLSKAELRVLKGWRWKEEWLLGELERLDELIYVLRDF